MKQKTEIPQERATNEVCPINCSASTWKNFQAEVQGRETQLVSAELSGLKRLNWAEKQAEIPKRVPERKGLNRENLGNHWRLCLEYSAGCWSTKTSEENTKVQKKTMGKNSKEQHQSLTWSWKWGLFPLASGRSYDRLWEDWEEFCLSNKDFALNTALVPTNTSEQEALKGSNCFQVINYTPELSSRINNNHKAQQEKLNKHLKYYQTWIPTLHHSQN